MRHKTSRSVLAAVLAIGMIFGILPVAVFANDAPTINYVSLGDSMSNGYCFTGYNQGVSYGMTQAKFEAGEEVYGDDAYPNLFAEWLLEQNPGYTVNHRKLAVSAMRAEDLYYLLGGRDMPTDTWFGQVENYSGTGAAELQRIYQDAVKDADIISMSIGNAAFGAYMVQYFTKMLGVLGMSLDPEEEVDIEQAISVLPEDKQAQIMDVYNRIVAATAPYIPENIGGIIDVQKLVDMVAYISVSFLINYEGVLEKIVELNPDVEVILIGLMNTTYGLTVSGEGFDTVPVGDIIDVVFDILNAYVAGVPAAMQAAGKWENAKFYYADMPNPKFIVQEFKGMHDSGWVDDGEGLSETVVRNRTIKAYNEALCGMIGAALGFDLPWLKIEDVAGYEFRDDDQYGIGDALAAQLDAYGAYMYENSGASPDPGTYPLADRFLNEGGHLPPQPEDYDLVPTIFAPEINKEISVAIYLALEDALALCTDNMNITLDGLMGIATDIFGALGDMPEALLANPGPKTIHDSLVGWFTADETSRGMCKIFAMFKVGDGMSVHPTPEAHEDIYNAMVDVYTNNFMAKDQIIALAAQIYQLAYDNGAEALTKAVEIAEEKGYITPAQAATLGELISASEKAIKNGETADLLAVCLEMAKDIYDYARANGYISDEVEEALIEAYKVYDELKDKTPEELKEIAKENIIALAEKYGPEVLEKVNEYILGLDVLDERQLGELEAKIAAYINEYYDDPEAGLEAAVNDIVDFVFEITEIDRDTVAAIYDYVTTTSKEEMIEDAAELLKEYLEAYGPAALEAVENYLISEGYVTADEIAAVTKQIGYAVAAYEAQDNAAVEASLNTLAKMVYDYADANGYIPAEVKEAVAAAIELYNKYGDLTPEEIKALVAAELQKFIAENKAAALIALETYIVNEGWMSEADLQELAQKIAAAIAAYEADPEGTTDKLVKELVDYVYAKAIEEGYIDPAQAEELVDLFNAAYEYYVNTPEEQIKADAINLLVSELDKHLEGKVDSEVYAQVKADIFALINYLETSTPEEIQADIDAFVADLVAKYEELVYNATHGKFIPNGESYYVALGSGTAYGLGIGRGDKGYFDLIVDALGLDAATQFKNLADPTLDTTKILEYIIKNAAEIQKADVITYQLDATAFVYAALSEEQPDWSKYFNTEDFAFIDEAIPVIKSILADDWTKYADIDAAQIVNDIKEQVLNSIDSAVMDAFKDQTDKLDELLSVCVAQVKSYVEYVQENAIELYKAILNDIARVNEAMAPVVEVINDNWASYADLDVEDIVNSVKDEVLAQLDELKVLTEDKVNEIIAVIVEKAVALHNHVAEQIANIPGYFSEEQLAFAEVVYSYVADYVIANYPELTEIDVEGKVNAIHEKAYSEIMDILRSADGFNYEQYVELGADEIKEVLNTCEDIVMAAIDAVQDKAITALETVENAQAVVAEALDFIAEYLFTDWASYVDMGVEEICNTIKDAFIAELAKQSAYGEQYVDEYADKITAVLTLCVEEVKAVLQNVQDVKEEALDIINTVEEYQTYINNVLYAAVAYAVDTAKAIEAIQTINPDAVLIVVGMYNPLDGFEVIVNNETINVGDYVDYLIDATNVYYTALAIADGEFIFVPVPDTEINGFTTPIDTKLINVNQLGMLLLGLNTKMYANAAGNEYIYEQIMDAVDTSDYEPDVDNRTKEEDGEFDAQVEFDEYFRTAYVTCDQACVVLAAQTDEEGETTYTRLVPQALEDGTYGFDLTGIEGKYVLVVALKGDYNLDGAVTTNDVAQANKAFVNGTEPSALQNYVFDMTGDDEITTNDVAKVNKAIVNETAIEW